MRKLDRTKRYGTIHGTDDKFPEAKYHQNGALFNSLGSCVAIVGRTGAEAYDPAVHDKPPPAAATGEAPVPDPEKQVEETVDTLNAEVRRLEDELDAAKNRDINAPDYTEVCRDAQLRLTQAKKLLTKARNSGAVLEHKKAGGDEEAAHLKAKAGAKGGKKKADAKG